MRRECRGRFPRRRSLVIPTCIMAMLTKISDSIWRYPAPISFQSMGISNCWDYSLVLRSIGPTPQQSYTLVPLVLQTIGPTSQ